MASSSSTIFLLAIITLASVCHIGADPVVDAQATVEKAISVIQGATKVAEKYLVGITTEPAQDCVDDFEGAAKLLNMCLAELKDFKKENVDHLQDWGTTAQTISSNCCKEDFGSTLPDDLKQACTNVNDTIVPYLNIVNVM